MPEPKRKRAPLTEIERLVRVNEMVRLAEKDIHEALWIEAALECGNERLKSTENFIFPGEETYKVIAHGMMIYLALTIARLFDTGMQRYHEDDRDVASIPLIVSQLRHPDVQDELLKFAQERSDDSCRYDHIVRENIDLAIQLCDEFSASTEGHAAILKLKEMRDIGIAHTLMKQPEQIVPTYNELFSLVDHARSVMECVLTVVNLDKPDLQKREIEWLEDAAKFWERAIPDPRLST